MTRQFTQHLQYLKMFKKAKVPRIEHPASSLHAVDEALEENFKYERRNHHQHE